MNTNVHINNSRSKPEELASKNISTNRLNIYILLSFAGSIITFLSLIDAGGVFGSILKNILAMFLGRGSFLILAIFIVHILILIRIQKKEFLKAELNFRLFWGALVFFISILGILSLIFRVSDATQVPLGGGFIGFFLYPFVLGSFGPIGGFFLLAVLLVFSIFLLSEKSVSDWGYVIQNYGRNPDLIWDLVPDLFEFVRNTENKPYSIENLSSDRPPLISKINLQSVNSDLKNEFKPVLKNKFNKLEINQKNNQPVQQSLFRKKAILKVGDWNLPDLILLKENQSHTFPREDISINQEKIKNTFFSFGINVTMGDAVIGPTVSQYTFRPASGIKLSRIQALQSDLALALAAKSIRMELPIPGQSAASIEIPNKHMKQVRIRDLIETKVFWEVQESLPIPIGKNVSGKDVFFSLSKAPHLLVAGATGSGKSVWINSLLLSLLYRYSPKNLHLILVDMKMVELNLYDNIPHLLSPVITESEPAINALKWSVVEMDKRYRLLKQYGKRNINDYNSFAKNMSLPEMAYVVFIIDELADLMMQAKHEVEPIIARLTAMSRAVGIHLVLGTQRPDVNVVTGIIKTNIPSRICFAVATQIDSRVVLDSIGGESLLGMGDGLFKSPSSIQPVRFQGANVEEIEIRKVVSFLIKEGERLENYSNLNPEVTNPPIGSINVPGLKKTKIEATDLPLLYEEARKLVIEFQQCSPQIVSGNLKIDIRLAKRIIDELEKNGVVSSPIPGINSRDVLIEKTDV
jgi:DNA segregation ATPase FtsK/SpoIIIE, S-DNA-T family